jgi:hypothetical protein
MKILWVKSDFLHPTTRGGQIRTLETLKRLHQRHQIHYVALQHPAARKVLRAAPNTLPAPIPSLIASRKKPPSPSSSNSSRASIPPAPSARGREIGYGVDNPVSGESELHSV